MPERVGDIGIPEEIDDVGAAHRELGCIEPRVSERAQGLPKLWTDRRLKRELVRDQIIHGSPIDGGCSRRGRLRQTAVPENRAQRRQLFRSE